MNISKKRKRMILDVVNEAFQETCEEVFQKGEIDHAPDQWDEWTTEKFDALSEMQSKVSEKIKEILDN